MKRGLEPNGGQSDVASDHPFLRGKQRQDSDIDILKEKTKDDFLNCVALQDKDRNADLRI